VHGPTTILFKVLKQFTNQSRTNHEPIRKLAGLVLNSLNNSRTNHICYSFKTIHWPIRVHVTILWI